MMQEQPDQFGLVYAQRPFKCSECGNRVMLGTNHTGQCYPQCQGKCRQISQQKDRHGEIVGETVLPKQTAHVYDVEAAQEDK